jgi:hypothetical protein
MSQPKYLRLRNNQPLLEGLVQVWYKFASETKKGTTGNPVTPYFTYRKMVAVDGVEPPTLRI